MTLLKIDESKCKKDGICVGECPVAIIHMADKDSFPALVPGGDQICLLCGHCVAICPHGALSHENIPIEECPKIEKDLALSEKQVVQFLRSRRSVRFFKDQPVEKETLQRLIEIARYAPTGGNNQSIQWTVYTDPEDIRNLAQMNVDYLRHVQETDPEAAKLPYIPMIIAAWDMGMDVVLRNAPAVVIASAPASAAGGMADVVLTLTYLELAAQPFKVGTCWAGLLHGSLQSWQPLKDAVGLPKDHIYQYPMMLGYAKPKYFRLPERKAPKITWK